MYFKLFELLFAGNCASYTVFFTIHTYFLGRPEVASNLEVHYYCNGSPG